MEEDSMMRFCLIFSAVLSVTQAVAAEGVGLFVEPAVTYESGKSRIDYPAPFSSSTGNVDGFGIAARLGFHISDVVFAGLDARYSMPHFTDSSVGYDASAKEYNWGPVVGIQMPLVGLRVWASYVLGGELDPDGSNNVDVKFTGANGYRIGAGFQVVLVSLNLEYQQLKYGSATLESFGRFPTNTSFESVKPNTDAWVLSVSFPLDL